MVWLLTGLWHGAAWNFVLWGGLFGVLLMAEKLWYGKFLARWRVLSHVYVLLVVVLSFVVFNANGLNGLIGDFKGLFGLGGYPLVTSQTLYYLRSYAVLLVVAAVAALPLGMRLYQKVQGAKVMTVLEPLAVALLMVAVTAYLVDGSFNPFLYFRF